MAFDLANMRTDRSAENEGVWVDFEGGLSLKIARLNNDHHQQYMLDKRRQIQRDQRLGRKNDLSREALREATIESMALHILKDWKNMIYQGQSVEYSIENAKRLLNEVPEFYRLVEDESINIENFRDEIDQAEQGNSGRSVLGKGAGGTQSPNCEASNEEQA